MIGLGYVSALLLAAVFARAGAAKLSRPAATAAAFAALGVPAARALALAVPAAELGLGAALVLVPRPAGAAALIVLGGFSALLAARRRAGVTAGCGCFGSARSGPVSAAELLRNALLSGLAAGAMAAERPVVPPVEAVVAVGAAAATGLVVLALADLRLRTGRLLENRIATGPEERW